MPIERREVCLWHKADVQTALMNVRFEVNNGHDADVARCLLMTQSGHVKIPADWGFDRLTMALDLHVIPAVPLVCTRPTV